MIKPVRTPMWETEDGKLFSTWSQAKDHEDMLVIRSFCDNNFSGGEYSPDMIADVLFNNRAFLAKMFIEESSAKDKKES